MKRTWTVETSRRWADGLGPNTIYPAVWNAFSACAAKASGATRLFLSGAAFNNTHGYPDRGVMDISEVAQTIREIHAATDLPVMVDIETGFGTLPRLSRFVDELARAGVTAIMIEDQDETGQSKTLTNASIGSPDDLIARMEVIRETVGDQISILARTDWIPAIDFEESLRRLQLYVEAGADWVIPVFAPSFDAWMEASRLFGDKLHGFAASPPISGVMRYSPSPADLQQIQPIATQITGQYRNVWQAMRTAYEQSLTGHWSDLFAARPEPIQFDIDMGTTRRGMQH